jgi:hypothetical protein
MTTGKKVKKSKNEMKTSEPEPEPELFQRNRNI